MELSHDEQGSAEPELNEYEQIEVRQHKLPEGFFTKAQMYAHIYGQAIIKQVEPTDWS